MSSPPKSYLLLSSILWNTLVRAQDSGLGTKTQDLTTYAAYSQQKECAQSCFIYGGGNCWTDIIGVNIGCAQTSCIGRTGFQARNDCYCSAGLIQPAQEFLAGCVSSKCSVGDVSVDVSIATGIYSRYCAEKGYTAGEPAQIPASTTTGTQRTTGTRLSSSPTATSTSGSVDGNGSSPSSSGSRSLSVGEIIGIVVGSLAGLAFLAIAMWAFWKLFRSCRKPRNPYAGGPVDQQPVYPKMPNQQQWYPSPGPASEVGPSDSISMVGGLGRPAPTLVSDARYPGRW